MELPLDILFCCSWAVEADSFLLLGLLAFFLFCLSCLSLILGTELSDDEVAFDVVLLDASEEELELDAERDELDVPPVVPELPEDDLPFTPDFFSFPDFLLDRFPDPFFFPPGLGPRPFCLGIGNGIDPSSRHFGLPPPTPGLSIFRRIGLLLLLRIRWWSNGTISFIFGFRM